VIITHVIVKAKVLLFAAELSPTARIIGPSQ
jgi:hypothetical protein